jgi:spoIIIJ-associated protein
MRSIEAEGNTIDDAIANALETLQVERDRVDIEILSDATRGLFGLGAKKARVRATLRALILEEEMAEEREEPQIREPEPRRQRPPRAMGERRAAPPARRPRRAPQDVETSEPSAADEAAVAPLPVPREAVDRGLELLRQTLDLMKIEAQVSCEDGSTPDDVVLQVEGEAAGIVIGRHGQGLDAIEYILNRMVAREFPGIGHIVVDAASYRARRRQSLTDMALRLAEKAKREQRTVTLNPLSPRDRRVVHIALRDDRGVSTRSQGTGLHRKLLIIPSGQPRRPNAGRYGGSSVRSR